MSDRPTDCDRFEDWLLEGDRADASAWEAHLTTCAGCREQWAAHRMLVEAFAGDTVPEPSPAFQAGLERKLAARIRVAPLRGWRLAALVGYAVTAAVLLGWVFAKFPPVTISLDSASPWTRTLALLAVPISLWLTTVAAKLLPTQRPRITGPLTL